jgi:hypothetical protein
MENNNDKNTNEEQVERTSDNILKNIRVHSHEEYQYVRLIENILENGVGKMDEMEKPRVFSVI